MYEELATLVSAITVIFGIFGIFLFLRFLSTWKKIDPDIIKARVFLAENFVMKNMIVIFVIGLLIAFHNFFEYLGMEQPDIHYRFLADFLPTRFIAFTELLVAIILVDWLMYQWIKIAES